MIFRVSFLFIPFLKPFVLYSFFVSCLCVVCYSAEMLSNDIPSKVGKVRRDLSQLTGSVESIISDFERERLRLESDLGIFKNRCSQLEQEVSRHSSVQQTRPSFQSLPYQQLGTSHVMPQNSYGIGSLVTPIQRGEFLIKESEFGEFWNKRTIHLCFERGKQIHSVTKDDIVSSNENYHRLLLTQDQEISRLSSSNVELTNLQSDINRLTTELNERQRNFDMERQQWQSTNQIILQEKNSLEAKYYSLQEKSESQKSKFSTEIARLQSEKNEMERIQRVVEDQKRKLETEIESLKITVKRSEEQISKMHNSLSEKDAMIQSGITTIQKLKSEHIEELRRKDEEWRKRQGAGVAQAQGYVQQQVDSYKKAVREILEHNSLGYLLDSINSRYADLL